MKHLTLAALCLFALTACGTSPAAVSNRLPGQKLAAASKKAPHANEIMIQREVDKVKREGKLTLVTFEGEEFDRVFIVDEDTTIVRAGTDEALTADVLEAGQRLTVDAYRKPRVDGKMPCQVLKIKVH